jgi:succinyl-CoA synthetase beta subunit
MNLHEYQGKQILKSFGVAIQEGIVADTPAEAVEAAKPEISYVTMADAKDFIEKRKNMSEKEFYDMFSK